jgi:hypothetical protein
MSNRFSASVMLKVSPGFAISAFKPSLQCSISESLDQSRHFAWTWPVDASNERRGTRLFQASSVAFGSCCHHETRIVEFSSVPSSGHWSDSSDPVATGSLKKSDTPPASSDCSASGALDLSGIAPASKHWSDSSGVTATSSLKKSETAPASGQWSGSSGPRATSGFNHLRIASVSDHWSDSSGPPATGSLTLREPHSPQVIGRIHPT